MLFPADLDGNLKFENVRAIDGLIEEQRKKFLKAIEVEHANAVKYMDTAVYLVSSVYITAVVVVVLVVYSGAITIGRFFQFFIVVL